MAVFMVKLRSRDFFDNYEFDSATVAEVFDDLQEDGCVMGSSLLTHTKEGAPGVRIIRDRVPAILMMEGIEWVRESRAQFEEVVE